MEFVVPFEITGQVRITAESEDEALKKLWKMRIEDFAREGELATCEPKAIAKIEETTS